MKEHKLKEYKLAEGEAKFAKLIWEKEPIPSPELVKLCEKEFNWKKSTTYTVLKKLCDRGIFRNEKAIVTSLISKEEFYSYRRFFGRFDSQIPDGIYGWEETDGTAGGRD